MKKRIFVMFFTMRIFLNILSVCFLAVLSLQAQELLPPKYEYRAVWLTTVENLDWPRTQVKCSLDIAQQQKELVEILDSLQMMNVNTVLLQTRVRGDVIYPSAIEPFSHVLTGVTGKDPGYDPLAFAIEECHKRGMQLHAWLVTMPLGKDDHIRRQGAFALSRRHRNLCTHYKGQWYMEPGNPDVDSYMAGIVREIVTNYDVDGIHFDYIRYPDRTAGYPDGALHRRHGRSISLSSWRRGNITRMVTVLYKTVKELKPWVRVSCAPLGKYDDLSRYSSLGWDAYNAVYQEAQNWLRDGVMDILFPMLYFDGNNFYPFVLDWQENSAGRHIVPGIGVYRLLPEYGGWPLVEIERQLWTSRSAGCVGTAMFRADHLLGCGKEVYSGVYPGPALVPPMDWAGDVPVSPSLLSVQRDMDGFSLQWQGVDANDGFPAMRYNVYASFGDTVDVGEICNLVASSVDSTYFRWECRTLNDVTFAVTATDAYGNESAPVVAKTKANPVLQFGGSIVLPGFSGMGVRIEILDIYGRRIYDGRYGKKLLVNGLSQGQYMLKVYDCHGALLYSDHFAK